MIPHLALPLHLDGTGRFAALEQDGLDDIAQNAAVCLATPVGSRVEVPEYGSPRAEFVGVDPEGMAAAVTAWEPRADLTVEAVAGLGDTETLVAVTAQVRAAL